MPNKLDPDKQKMPNHSRLTAASFGQHVSPGSLFLSGERQIADEPGLLPYAHYLRQAWKELGLSGVLCVDGRPTVYLCEGVRFTQEQKREKHLLAWNQGLVPLLVFLTPDCVEAHSTVKKPEERTRDQHLFEAELPSLIPNLGHVSEALECARLVRSIETGQFFHDHAEFFPAGETVDRCLIENLTHTARRLVETGWSLAWAHSLLGRTLFVSFLQEREFIKPSYYPDGTTSLLDILTSKTQDRKRLLYREFFPRLKREFNGTMFDSALAEEEHHVDQIHLEILAHFLSGTDMQSGQTTLGFWAYNFRFIPVETISAIYEEFMKDSALSRRRELGAYYTPRHLAETTLHVALDGRYIETDKWRGLDPSCGSGIFLVALFNLLSERWLLANPTSRRQTRAQALLDILQNQIRGVDISLDACRIAAFSLYLALFEKLQPIDVDDFKAKVSHERFLPPLLWDKEAGKPKPEAPVIIHADFLKEDFLLDEQPDLVVGNPPWESRGSQQVALHFAKRTAECLRPGGIGCLLLPSSILVNRHGTLDGEWFRKLTVEKIVQLADLRFVLFEATHPCFIIRFVSATPPPEHVVAYETPKFNRFDWRTGVIVVEPDDLKLIPQRDVLETALQDRLQSTWIRRFWGTPRDEAFLRRLDFYPRLSELVGTRGRAKRWLGGTGFQPYRENRNRDRYVPVPIPWPLTEPFLDASALGSGLVVFKDQFTTVGGKLRKLGASTKNVLFSRVEANFTPPMVLYTKGFTKMAFCGHKVRFQDALRSITGQKEDADLLRFLAAVIASRLVKYQAFHSGSSNGIGRDQFHLYESLNLAFPLPDHELAPSNAKEIIREAAGILKAVERNGKNPLARPSLLQDAVARLEPLVETYYSVTDAERVLIRDTLTISQPSIHPSSLDARVPSLEFPGDADRARYAATLCDVLNRRARMGGVKISAQGMASKALNLILFTVIFSDTPKPYTEVGGEDKLWKELDRLSRAAQRQNGPFNYLRGFSYFEHDRLHMLKPATMRNWCGTAALNDADAIFEHLATGNT